MKRRSFLRHSFHAMAVPGVLGTMGFSMPGSKSMEYLLRQAAETDRVLVLMFLAGGNDGLNSVVPLDSIQALNVLRPHVMLQEKDLVKLQSSEVGLHPSMAVLKDLYDESRFQIVQNVGYPEPDFSHFRSTDIWVSGSGSNEVISSGWLGRHIENQYPDFQEEYPNEDMKDPLSVELGQGSTFLFQGVTGQTNYKLESADSFYELVENIEQDAPDTPAGDKLKFIRSIARQSQAYGQRIKEVAERVTDHVDYPSSSLADQLKIVSKLIAGGSRTPIYLVKHSGYDTHDSQVDPNDHTLGEHSTLLLQMSEAISAFMKDLDYHNISDKVLGMTFSEFGRTIHSNASYGTDHGTAAPMFFFGNAVRGGIVGDNPVVDTSMEYYDNLPHTYDFRQMYHAVLNQWFGIDTSEIDEVLFGSFSSSVEIIGDPVIEPEVPLNTKKSRNLSVYPNPLGDFSTIRFEGHNRYVKLSAVDLKGNFVQTVYEGIAKPGLNEIAWNTTQLVSGRYLLLLRSENGNRIFSVVK